MAFKTNFLGDELNCSLEILNIELDPAEGEIGSDLLVTFDTKINGKDSANIASAAVSVDNGTGSIFASNTSGNSWEAEFSPLGGSSGGAFTVTIAVIDANGDEWQASFPIEIP